MIQHDIIVVKETPVVPYQYTGWTGHNVSPMRWPNIASQDDLNNWLQNTKFNIGDYVTYCKLPLCAANMPHAVFIVMARCEDFKTMMSQPHAPYHHRLLFLQSLESKVCEWRDINSLRLVDTTEVDNTIRPYIDRVRNSRQP